MSQGIQGPQDFPISSKDQTRYREEYRHSADLFERALKEHASSQNTFQKEEFEKVMKQALHVLNETARELKSRERLAQNQAIEKDFQVYEQSPNPQAQERLLEELEKAKRLS